MGMGEEQVVRRIGSEGGGKTKSFHQLFDVSIERFPYFTTLCIRFLMLLWST